MVNNITTVQLAELVKNLGPTIVDAIIGHGRGFVLQVLNGDEVLTDAQRDTLGVAFEAFTLLKENEGLDVTRAWFVGTNARLEVSQITALRTGEFAAVLASAQAVVNDTPASAV
jgi:hypothetical protein